MDEDRKPQFTYSGGVSKDEMFIELRKINPENHHLYNIPEEYEEIEGYVEIEEICEVTGEVYGG